MFEVQCQKAKIFTETENLLFQLQLVKTKSQFFNRIYEHKTQKLAMHWFVKTKTFRGLMIIMGFSKLFQNV